jgi:hypothetical protein
LGFAVLEKKLPSSEEQYLEHGIHEPSAIERNTAKATIHAVIEIPRKPP